MSELLNNFKNNLNRFVIGIYSRMTSYEYYKMESQQEMYLVDKFAEWCGAFDIYIYFDYKCICKEAYMHFY